MEHNRTKHCRAMKWLFGILHFLLLFGPFFYFIPYGFATGTRGESLGLGLMVVVALVLVVFSIISDVKHRAGLHKAIMWILIGGILICLQEVEVFIWIMVGVSLLDELVICPLVEHYKTALIANKEIDKR